MWAVRSADSVTGCLAGAATSQDRRARGVKLQRPCSICCSPAPESSSALIRSVCVARTHAQPTQYSSSVEIGADWAVVEQINTTSLGRLNYNPGEPVDLLACGSLEYYDKVGGREGGSTGWQ